MPWVCKDIADVTPVYRVSPETSMHLGPADKVQVEILHFPEREPDEDGAHEEFWQLSLGTPLHTFTLRFDSRDFVDDLIGRLCLQWSEHDPK